MNGAQELTQSHVTYLWTQEEQLRVAVMNFAYDRVGLREEFLIELPRLDCYKELQRRDSWEIDDLLLCTLFNGKNIEIS